MREGPTGGEMEERDSPGGRVFNARYAFSEKRAHATIYLALPESIECHIGGIQNIAAVEETAL